MLQDKHEILQEQHRFYKELYGKDVTLDHNEVIFNGKIF